MTERDLLTRTAALAADYLESLGTRAVAPGRTYRDMLAALDAPVPDSPSDPTEVVEELAAAVVFLCSEPASYITGVSLLVDGGLSRGIH